jgi:hypothetical protein
LFVSFFETLYLLHGAADALPGIPYIAWSNFDQRVKALTAPYFGMSGDPNDDYQVTTGRFRHWYTLNPTGRRSKYHIRREVESRYWDLLFTAKDVDGLITGRPQYDTPPWEIPCTNGSFSNGLEGFINYNATAKHCGHRYYHNLLHLIIGGDQGDMASLVRSANDPIFYMLHVWVDHTFERWFQFHQPRSVEGYVPMAGGPPGHSGMDCAAPIFPCTHNAQAFRPARELGYSYRSLNQTAAPGSIQP